MSSIGRVTAGQLAYWQAAFAATCNTTATVQRNTSIGTPNPDGTVPSTLTTIYTNIPALVSEAKGNYAQALAAALIDQAMWQVAVPVTFLSAAVVILRGDVVLVNSLVLTVQHLLGSESYPVNVNFLASAPR